MEHETNMAKAYEPFLNMIIKDFCSHKQLWDAYVNVIARLDVIMSLATSCKNMAPKCIPNFVKDDKLCIKKGFHIGLLQVIEGATVPNSLEMKEEEKVLLLTGPNMGGKSTFLRQTCQLAILAQLGCYVPAQEYSSIVFDQIFCRIGASDRIIEGKSTFYVELEETKRILTHATDSSLVIID